MPGPFDVQWIHGSADCAHNADPPIQVHPFDDDTYILRESKCLNYEGNFMYLLVGQERALLLDSGSRPIDGRPLPLRKTVDAILAQLGKETIELVVAHSHS